MRILITGINGLLGSELAATLGNDHEISGLSRTGSYAGYKVYDCDICDFDTTYGVITKANPDIVIHTAAQSNVDACELDPDAAFRINALGTRNVALACQRFDAAMMYISTDYAFSGRTPPKDGYDEYCVPDPVNVYARSKVAGEEYVQRLLAKYYIIRPSWLFGKKRQNFILQLAESFKKGSAVTMVSDMVSSPTYAKDLSETIARLLVKPRYGIYHLCNGGFASRCVIAEKVADMMGAPASLIKKVSLQELSLPATRPHFSGLRNYVSMLEGMPPLRPWQDAVAEFLTELHYI